MASYGYAEALMDLKEYRRKHKYKRLLPNTYLWAEHTNSRVWDEVTDGPLKDPAQIYVTLHRTPILMWHRDAPNNTHFVSNSTSRTTIRRINELTNFQVWSAGGHCFIKLRYGDYCLPYPLSSSPLNNETGRYVDGDWDWLNEIDAYEYYQASNRIAGKLVHNLVYGKMTRGWESFEGKWREDTGALAGPTLALSAWEEHRDGVYNDVRILLGALERYESTNIYRDLILSCRPGVTYEANWKPRTKAQKLDRVTARLAGKYVKYLDDEVRHPRNLYKELKDSVRRGLLQAANMDFGH